MLGVARINSSGKRGCLPPAGPAQCAQRRIGGRARPISAPGPPRGGKGSRVLKFDHASVVTIGVLTGLMFLLLAAGTSSSQRWTPAARTGCGGCSGC